MLKRILFQTLFTLLLSELVLVMFFQDKILISESEKSTIYQFDSELGWSGIPNSVATFDRSVKINVAHNSMGFRDIEHSKIKDKPRILFLGDSFTWGYDVELEERFDRLLQKKMSEYEIFNLGISGYSTDQELLQLEKHFKEIRPDIVSLIYCENDRLQNQSNAIFMEYRKPYFHKKNGVLELEEKKVIKCEQYYYKENNFLSRSCLYRALVKIWIRLVHPVIWNEEDLTEDLILAIKQFSENNGASFFVGFIDLDYSLKEDVFCQENDLPFIDLANPYKFAEYGQHWTPEGHKYVSEKLFHFLNEHLDN
ncbi:MAG: SGNH/GDSL hydrolase family protein [Saprospiraceae bacterium]|nr:SGNH/GDSL hydrolase family protein [Saprospiraceae bacterium]